MYVVALDSLVPKGGMEGGLLDRSRCSNDCNRLLLCAGPSDVGLLRGYVSDLGGPETHFSGEAPGSVLVRGGGHHRGLLGFFFPEYPT